MVFWRIYVTKRNRINCGARQIGCVNFSRAFSRPRIVPWNFAGCKYSKGHFRRTFCFHETLKWKRSITIRSNLIIVISNGPPVFILHKNADFGFYATREILLHLISLFVRAKAPEMTATRRNETETRPDATRRDANVSIVHRCCFVFPLFASTKWTRDVQSPRPNLQPNYRFTSIILRGKFIAF